MSTHSEKRLVDAQRAKVEEFEKYAKAKVKEARQVISRTKREFIPTWASNLKLEAERSGVTLTDARWTFYMGRLYEHVDGIAFGFVMQISSVAEHIQSELSGRWLRDDGVSDELSQWMFFGAGESAEAANHIRQLKDQAANLIWEARRRATKDMCVGLDPDALAQFEHAESAEWLPWKLDTERVERYQEAADAVNRRWGQIISRAKDRRCIC